MFPILENPLVRQYAVVVVANLSLLVTGIGLVWTSPVLVMLRDIDQTPLDRVITEEEGSWIVSIHFLMAIFGNFIPFALLNRIGRKPCVVLSTAPKIVSWLLFTFANDVWMLLLGRAINGVTDIIIFNAVPVYASEIASTKIRGALGIILQIMCSVGILIMYSTGPFLPYVTLNAIFTGVVVVATIPLLFLPESPYFLYTKGRTEEAIKVLTFFRGTEVEALDEIKGYSGGKTEQVVGLRDLFESRLFFRALLLATVIAVGMQLIGFNAVQFYLQTILVSTGTSVRPEISSVIIGCIQLVGSIFAALVADRFGRKLILLVTLAGQMMGLVGLGTFFYVTENADYITGALNYLPLISLLLVVFSYSTGPGSVFWPLVSELFDGPSRGVGIPISICMQMVFGFLILQYFATLTSVLGPAWTYWAFSISCVLLFSFILILVPETKGKTFAEIQAALGGKPKIDEENVKESNDSSG